MYHPFFRDRITRDRALSMCFKLNINECRKQLQFNMSNHYHRRVSARFPSRPKWLKQNSCEDNNNFDVCPDPHGKYVIDMGLRIDCNECGWRATDVREIEPMHLRAGWYMSSRSILESHARGQKEKYTCRVCSVVHNLTGFGIHIKNHSIAEIKQAYGERAAYVKV